MKRLYVVTMSDGSRWGVPAEVIANHRAVYYAKIDPDTTYQEEYDAMIYWFDEGDYEFADWAKDNMNWSDVREQAIELPRKQEAEPIWKECWVNGEYEYIVEDKS